MQSTNIRDPRSSCSGLSSNGPELRVVCRWALLLMSLFLTPAASGQNPASGSSSGTNAAGPPRGNPAQLIQETAPGSGVEKSAGLVVRGVVFEDADRDRRRGGNETGLAGIRVSNGREIVLTDESGRYELPIAEGGAVFVIKPRGWMTPLNEQNLPRFFYLHKPTGSPRLRFPGSAPTGPLPQSVDFPLHRQDEPEKFEVLLFGDPQPRDLAEVDYIAHDVVRSLIGSGAAFGVTLGDIVFDDLAVMEPLNQTIGLVGIPWYNVMGNHDINTDVRSRDLINETFESHYGPSHYSFDRGQVHFVVMDNIGWGETPEQPGTYRVKGEFGNDQLEFLRRDLELVPRDQMVVLMMHIPLQGTADTLDLFRLIEDRPLCISIAAHTHNHTHVFFDAASGWRGRQPHHHIINVTVSGSWWSGKADERGIPHAMMTDGAPNGHSVLTFDGNRYALDYVAAGVERGQQMRIMLADEVPVTASAETGFHVNVFNGSERSRVEFRIDGGGEWQTLERVEAEDPDFRMLYDEDQRYAIFGGQRLNKPALSSHLWQGKLGQSLSPGVHLVEVRTTDMFDRQYVAQRSVRVTAANESTSAEAGAESSTAESGNEQARQAGQAGTGASSSGTVPGKQVPPATGGRRP